MFSRSFLTTIIGFLTGCILYFIIEPYTTFIFLFGGLGYVIGLILDNSDRKKQVETFHFSSIPSSHEIYHSQEIPEAVIIYSAIDNTTSVLLDYRIEAKPENYRLSVLKNLQEFDFRIIEDSSQTFFALCIEYPEFNYPSNKIGHRQIAEFYYNIKELSNDFQSAIQKLIPGIVICIVQNPDIFGNQTISNDNSLSLPPSSHFHSSPHFNSGSMPFDEENESDKESETSIPDASDEQVIEDKEVNSTLVDIDQILEDLNQAPVPKEDLNEGSSKKTYLGGNMNQVQTKSKVNESEIAYKSKKSSLLTAKQIEESKDYILTHEETEKQQAKTIPQSMISEIDKKSSQVIFDYSSVESSSSMPMDAAGQGIFSKILNAVEELKTKQTKNPEKNLRKVD